MTNQLSLELISILSKIVNNVNSLSINNVIIYNVNFTYKEIYDVSFECLSKDRLEVLVSEIKETRPETILRLTWEEGDWFDHDYKYWENT